MTSKVNEVSNEVSAVELNQELTEAWESGKFGQSEEHARVASSDVSNALDASLSLHLVSIRLQRNLIDALKLIAQHHGVAYQPLIRDLLNRFAKSELTQISYELGKKLEVAEAAHVVEEFMGREQSQRKTA